MPRYTQTWICTACGHVSYKTVKYPKYGEPDTPLTVIAKRARCTKCGTRGACKIEERKHGIHA